MRSRWTWKAWTPFFLFFFYWTPQEFVDISTSIVLLPRRSIGRNCYFIPPLRTVYPKSQEKSYFHYLSLRTDQDSFLSFYLLVDLDLRIRFIYVDLFGCISAASWTKDFHIIASAFLFLANRCEKTTLFFSVLLIVLTIVLSSDFTTKNRNGSLFLTEKRIKLNSWVSWKRFWSSKPIGRGSARESKSSINDRIFGRPENAMRCSEMVTVVE